MTVHTLKAPICVFLTEILSLPFYETRVPFSTWSKWGKCLWKLNTFCMLIKLSVLSLWLISPVIALIAILLDKSQNSRSCHLGNFAHFSTYKLSFPSDCQLRVTWKQKQTLYIKTSIQYVMFIPYKTPKCQLYNFNFTLQNM